MIKRAGNSFVQPKYMEVYDSIKGQISDGDLCAGSLIPSENELAEKFSVSRVTVRNAINALKGESLLDSIPGVGHRVVKITSTPIELSPLFFLGRRDDITLMLYEGIQAQGRECGLGCRMLSYMNTCDKDEIDFSDDFLSGIPFGEISGLIFFSDKRPGENFAKFIKEKRIPMLCAGYKDSGDFDSVLSDLEDSSVRMADEIFKRGHRRVLYASDEYLEKNVESFMLRSRAFNERFRELGGLVEQVNFLYNNPGHTVNSVLLEKFKDKVDAGSTCVVVSNAYMARGFAEQSVDSRYIPEKVSMAVFMSDRYGFRQGGGVIQFSGMIENLREIGRTAVEVILSRIRFGDGVPKTVLIKTSFFDGDTLRDISVAEK